MLGATWDPDKVLLRTSMEAGTIWSATPAYYRPPLPTSTLPPQMVYAEVVAKLVDQAALLLGVPSFRHNTSKADVVAEIARQFALFDPASPNGEEAYADVASDIADSAALIDPPSLGDEELYADVAAEVADQAALLNQPSFRHEEWYAEFAAKSAIKLH